MQKGMVVTLGCSLVAMMSVVSTNVAAEGTIIGKVGLLGGGLEYVYPISSKFAVGVGYNGFTFDDSIEENDINFDADLEMKSFSLLGDYHPFENGFRLTGGIYQNGNEFKLTGTPVGEETVEIGGTTYSAADVGSLTGVIDFDGTAPYLGFGWGKAPKSGKGFGFDLDIGVLFQGAPNVSLTATCGDALLADPAGLACPQLESDVAVEEAELRESSEDFEVYPVISAGISYTF